MITHVHVDDCSVVGVPHWGTDWKPTTIHRCFWGLCQWWVEYDTTHTYMKANHSGTVVYNSWLTTCSVTNILTCIYCIVTKIRYTEMWILTLDHVTHCLFLIPDTTYCLRIPLSYYVQSVGQPCILFCLDMQVWSKLESGRLPSLPEMKEMVEPGLDSPAAAATAQINLDAASA